MGTGKGLLDSLIAEGGMKSRVLSWVIYIGVVIEIRRARSDRNVVMAFPTSHGCLVVKFLCNGSVLKCLVCRAGCFSQYATVVFKCSIS